MIPLRHCRGFGGRSYQGGCVPTTPIPLGSASCIVITGHTVQNALPDPLITPLAVASVHRLPFPESLGELPPGSPSLHHPEHALQHRSMIVRRSPDTGVGRRKQRAYLDPLLVRQGGAGLWEDRGGRRRSSQRSGCCPSGRTRLVCSGLVATTKAGPFQTKGEPLWRLDCSQQQATNLGHRQRKQAIRRSPFFARSS